MHNVETDALQDEKNKPASTVSNIVSAAGVVSAATLASRILGCGRDVVIASLFGTGMVADAFFIAFTIPNLMRRLFGEGSLSIAFIPVYTGVIADSGQMEASRLAGAAFKITALALTLVSAAGIVAAPWLVRHMAPGWVGSPEKTELCITLTRIMTPYLLFVGLLALCMGVLNVRGHFAAPALSPACLNACMILAVVAAGYFSTTQQAKVMWLAYGVLLGGVLQLIVQAPFLGFKQIREFGESAFWHPALKQIFALMAPALFGSAVYQVNNLVIRFMASQLPQGSVSYLYYADRLVQLPLGLFGIAVAAAVLPELSKHAAARRWRPMREAFCHAMRLVLFITFPAMVGLIVLREPIVALLFEYGAFDKRSMQLTAGVLLYYGIGLWAFAAVRIVLSVFYALRDTRTPVVVGAVSIAANALLGFLLMRTMQHNGLALALSLSCCLNLAMLIAALHKRLDGLDWSGLAVSAARTSGSAALMGTAVYAMTRWLLSEASVSHLRLLYVVGLCIVTGIILYGLLAHFFKSPELQMVTRMIVAKRTKAH